MKNQEFWMDRGLAVACVNSDASGLNGKYLEYYNGEILNGHVIILDDQVDFRRCHVTRLFSDCVLVSVEKMEGAE